MKSFRSRVMKFTRGAFGVVFCLQFGQFFMERPYLVLFELGFVHYEAAGAEERFGLLDNSSVEDEDMSSIHFVTFVLTLAVLEAALAGQHGGDFLEDREDFGALLFHQINVV